VWRVELGPSYSGPIVSADRVFVTETKDKKYELVHAFNRADGTLLWSTDWEGAMKVPFFARSNGDWIRATPAFDENSLYVAGMRDVLVCLNPATGDERWKLDFVEQTGSPLPAFGFVSSPLIAGDHVYVQAGSSFVKVEKTTGSIAWQTLKDGGGMYGSAFSSPYLARVGEADQMIVQTREKLAGVALDSGQVLWSQKIPAFRGMNILTPTVVDDTVFTSSYGGKSFLYHVSSSGTAWQVEENWVNKVQGYMSSPVVIDGHIYLHLRNQRFVCVDIATGREKWTTKPFGKYWSLVANGGQILALDERGELLLINANPEKFDLVDRREISEDPTWAHLAVCGDEIFVRELNAITAYRWR
jgi:outer membrane protein assembly factor BamB